MATTQEHLDAREDDELRDRFMAAAEQAGIANAEVWVDQNIGALLTAHVAGGSTIADVHGYAAGEYRRKMAEIGPTPGSNPAAVTDDYLRAAVAEVLS